MIAIATIPAFSHGRGAPASRRPSVTQLSAVSAAAASSPAGDVCDVQASDQQRRGEQGEGRPRAAHRPAERERRPGRDEDQRDPGEHVGDVGQQRDRPDDDGDRERQDQRPARGRVALQPRGQAGAGQADEARPGVASRTAL